MSQRLRLALVAVGLILIAMSLVLLAYALWPVEATRELFPLEPTLFVPPQSLAVWLRLA